MPKIYNYRDNRKKIFESGNLRLWGRAIKSPSEENSEAVLELTQLESGTKSKWKTLWKGKIKAESWGVKVDKSI
jgi:hypothetical protein